MQDGTEEVRKVHAMTANKPTAKTFRAPPASGPRALRDAAPNWQRFCGWCARTTQVATDGRNLLCSRCGH